MPKKPQTKAKEAAASPVTKEDDAKPSALQEEHQQMQFRFHNSTDPSTDLSQQLTRRFKINMRAISLSHKNKLSSRF